MRNLRKQNYAKKVKVTIPYTKDLYPFLQKILSKYGILTIPQKHKCLNNFIKRGKDFTTNSDKCHCIYIINCKNCKASYVGQSKRPLHIRIKEHKNSRMSVFTKHSEETGHSFDWDNFQIIRQENDQGKREFAEMVYISLQEKGLNIMNDTKYLFRPYPIAIDKLIKTRRI